jgi:diacylglycerol kinase family enzyme
MPERPAAPRDPGDGPPFLVVSPGASRLAGAPRRAALVAAAEAALRERTGVRPEVRVTWDAVRGRAAADEAVAAGAGLLVVLGGDGSVRTAAAALAGTGIPLGIVPAGTGNLLATALGIPRRPERAIAVLATATVRPIDVGRARLRGGVDGFPAGGGVPLPEGAGAPAGDPAVPPDPAAVLPGDPVAGTQFLVAAGIGFDARVMRATTDHRKRSLGIAAYFATATAVAARLRPFDVRLVVDGVVHETDALAVLVANAGELVPGLLRPRLPLVPDDGLLDVLVARGRGALGGARGALELLTGRGIHTAVGPYAARMAGWRIEVEAAVPEPVEIDGDVVGAGGFTVEAIPGALLVLVPA